MKRTAATLCFYIVIAAPLPALYALRSEVQDVRAEMAELRRELAAAPQTLAKRIAEGLNEREP